MGEELLPVEGPAELRMRRSAKWRAQQADVLPLTIAEMDFPLAPAVRDVLRTAVERSDTGYGFAGDEFPAALAGFAGRRWGWEIDPARVVATTDVSTGVVALLRAVARPGETVVMNTPSYPPFPAWLDEAGVRRVEVPLAGAGLDLAALERAFAARPAAYLLCNPQNPTGRVHSPEELAEVVALARRHGVLVVSDEIHAPLTLPGAVFTPLLTVPGAAETALSVVSASKAWNLAGLKCAAIVAGSAAMAEVTDRLPADTRWRIGHLGVLASIAAFTEGEAWLDRLLATLDDRRRFLGDLLERELPGVGWQRPEATFLAWLDCAGLPTGEDTARVALERGRVAFEEGRRFGPDSAGHVRLNFATSREILTEAVTRLAGAVAAGA
ncbi:aminotransferase class I/II-fold pyridoxal phosphate-dependent enzyme [Streptomyces sp. NPDC047002]|uniref:MalY/PatB family protein n=1 Tax=Streptomyces sp. NPDC047002 TaxID=3155475 RepID=UPI0034547358